MLDVKAEPTQGFEEEKKQNLQRNTLKSPWLLRKNGEAY